MNNILYYNRQKEVWGDDEISKLKKMYDTDCMTISQIADIHRRTPGSIAFKLKNIGIVKSHLDTRGYAEYKNSELYKSIIREAEASEESKKVKREASRQLKADKIILNENKSAEYFEIKQEISSLKSDVKEILRLINAIYEFETE